MSLGNTLRNRDEFVPPKLQITAMMDMFTIIVFFLLFSYAERPDEVELTSDINLPVSNTQRDYDNTIKVFLSVGELKIDDEVVASIVEEKISGYDPEHPRNNNIYRVLEKIRNDRLKLQKEMVVEEIGEELAVNVVAKSAQKSQVLFFCDKSVPFRVINTVMKTIGMAGYPNMQFAVTGER